MSRSLPFVDKRKEDPTNVYYEVFLTAETASATIDEDNSEHSNFEFKEDITFKDRVPGRATKTVSSDEPSANQDEETELSSVSSFVSQLDSDTSLGTLNEDDGDEKDTKVEPSIMGSNSKSTDKDDDDTKYSSLKSKEDPTCTDRVPWEDTKPVSTDEPSASQDEEPAALYLEFEAEGVHS